MVVNRLWSTHVYHVELFIIFYYEFTVKLQKKGVPLRITRMFRWVTQQSPSRQLDWGSDPPRIPPSWGSPRDGRHGRPAHGSSADLWTPESFESKIFRRFAEPIRAPFGPCFFIFFCWVHQLWLGVSIGHSQVTSCLANREAQTFAG